MSRSKKRAPVADPDRDALSRQIDQTLSAVLAQTERIARESNHPYGVSRWLHRFTVAMIVIVSGALLLTMGKLIIG